MEIRIHPKKKKRNENKPSQTYKVLKEEGESFGFSLSEQFEFQRHEITSFGDVHLGTLVNGISAD